jgi:hypothetical protein
MHLLVAMALTLMMVAPIADGDSNEGIFLTKQV